MNHSLGFPQGKPYNLHGKEDEKWSLSRLTNVADRIALLLREDPPYGKCCNLCSIQFWKATINLGA